MKRIAYILAVSLLAIVSCTDDTDRCMKFLYDCMPLPDRMVHTEDWWRSNVVKTLEVRERMGWDVPEREFMHFVLPLRVNNESLDDFRLIYADSLCARVQGLTMEEAALEINHWCHEMATYKPSDARTSSPLATIRYGLGRCGEESVLAVAALRAAGIPARQVYTPRWAHTDDNHAWVEVCIDGKWHFMGACEPEAVLDLAWFNAPVSRAMLLHTKAFGDYHGDEDVISRTRAYTEINVIKGYIPARRNVVTVRDAHGVPVEGATVEFRIYNYAEYFTVASYLSDKDGHASLDTGLGDVVIWASKDDMFGITVASSEIADVVLEHRFGDVFSLDLNINPPAENPLPSRATDEQMAANALRLAQEDSIRAARPHGNAAVLDAFAAAHPDASSITEAIVASLSFKDLNDVTYDVLEDAFKHAGDSFEEYVDCPRIELEVLYPFFDEIGKGLDISDAREAWAWTCENIAVDDESNPQQLRIPPVFVWRERVADQLSRDIFYVALCRALGFPARIDEVTGKVQYMEDGSWNDVRLAENAPQGTLSLDYVPQGTAPVKDPEYYSHFSLASVNDGTTHLLSFDENGALKQSVLFSEPYPLDEGYYMMTSGRRLASGGVLSHVEFFNVNEGARTSVPLVLRSEDGTLPVLGTFDAEQLFLPEGSDSPKSILSATGRGYFIVAVLGAAGDEPSNHARQQLGAAAEDLNAWGRKLVLLSDYGIRIDGLQNAVYGRDVDGKVMRMLSSGVSSDSGRLPVIVVGDSFGRIVYYTQGYNTSLAEDLRTVMGKL